MKNFNLLALVASFTLVFSSCSTNENLLPEEQSLNLLKEYTIKRDASGAYSLDYILNDNAEVENVKDVKTNTNNIYLYPSNIMSKKQMSESLSIDGDQLKIGFIDTNSDKQPKITIIDDNIVFSKGSTKDKEMLAEYGITGNGDGTYDLNFKVENKVDVDFVYNEEDGIYEIHLEKGKGSGNSFERTFTKNEGSDLKITFINHNNISLKGADFALSTKKPELIIQ